MNQTAIHKIETLINKAENFADPEARALSLELVQALMELHGEGFNRMLEVIAENPAGQSIIEKLGDEELVAGLMVLYGLHPQDLETRVKKAIEKVGPILITHGGSVTLDGIDNGVVRLTLLASSQGCGSTGNTMKAAIEEAVFESAPDVVELIINNVAPEPKPTAPLQITRNRTPAERAIVTAAQQA
jgi:Fe-S cluster biogenesis protein NfuA